MRASNRGAGEIWHIVGSLCCSRTMLREVFEDYKDDFWMLKNMTHLLLDLDGNVHVSWLGRG